MLDARIGAKRLASGEMLLQDIGVSAAPGEVVVLLGASGIGKTATLRILLGLDRIFEGSVVCTAARIGAVFQEPSLLPWRTVGDNIRLVVPQREASPDVEALLESVGLAGTASLYPRQISLGMARRVALARALAIAPDLLVLDEPFASLDPGTAGLLATLLAEHVRSCAAALVMAMHDVDRALALATRIVVLEGRPATAAQTLKIPAATTAPVRTGMRAALLREFPFLAPDEI